MNNDRGNKWAAPELRAAAIDYCIAQMPPPSSLASPAGVDWLQRCSAACGPQLGLPARELADILREYRAPANIRLPDAPAAAELPEHVVTEKTIAAGLADTQETALETLLREEEWCLDNTERDALAAAMETGSALTDSQRHSVALLLRHSSASARADLLRGILEWICPELTKPVYTVRQGQITVKGPCTVETVPAHQILDTDFYTLNRQHVRITETTTGRVWVHLYCSVCESTTRRPDRRRFILRFLESQGTHYDDATIRKNLTLLIAFAKKERRHGSAWAQNFRETRAMVSHRRRRLTDHLNETAGGRANLPGMKPHRDPRRGTTKKR